MVRQKNIILYSLDLTDTTVILKLSLPHVLSQKNYIGFVTGVWWQIGENQPAKIAVPGMSKTKGAGL